ncbi:MAG: putative rRNA maturation factor [Candidatus Midichloriaceae bacterium]|jgi:probable rRNA maturation factor
MKKAEPEPSLIKFDISIESTDWTFLNWDIEKYCNKVLHTTLDTTLKDKNLPPIEIALLLTNDEKMQSLNKKFRNNDKVTNILSFPFTENIENLTSDLPLCDKDVFLGNIAIGYEKVMKESLYYGEIFQEYFSYILTHGILHLLGYDHIKDVDADIMENIEKIIMKKMGYNFSMFNIHNH